MRSWYDFAACPCDADEAGDDARRFPPACHPVSPWPAAAPLPTSDHWRLAFALWRTPYHDEKIQVFGRSAALDMAALHPRPDDAEARVLMAVLQAAITGLAFRYEARGTEMDLEACFVRLEEALAPAFLQAMEDAG
jgi:hypothetical protein